MLDTRELGGHGRGPVVDLDAHDVFRANLVDGELGWHEIAIERDPQDAPSGGVGRRHRIAGNGTPMRVRSGPRPAHRYELCYTGTVVDAKTRIRPQQV